MFFSPAPFAIALVTTGSLAGHLALLTLDHIQPLPSNLPRNLHPVGTNHPWYSPRMETIPLIFFP